MGPGRRSQKHQWNRQSREQAHVSSRQAVPSPTARNQMSGPVPRRARALPARSCGGNRAFRGLEVWQTAHQITLELYKVTTQFPREELYGLTSQMRRCSASIAANIAEGCGKRGEGEFNRFLQIASGSASEFDYHLILAHDLGFLKKVDYERLSANLAILRRRLSALISTVDDQRNSAKAKG